MHDSFEAQVIATFGRHLLVREASGRVSRARPFGRKLAVVCGDRVLCRRGAGSGSADGAQEVHAVEVMPRRSMLHRTNTRGRAELIAANLDLLLVMVAPVPQPDFFVVDRFLAAAASAGIAAALVLNKCELAIGEALQSELLAYEELGYELARASAASGRGVGLVAELIGARIATLVGQSGVGKSSMVQQLSAEDHGIAVGELMRDGEGRHTTTTSRLYECRGAGQLIDSPGVRDFAPSIEHLEPATLGFVDIAALAPGCRYPDCRHMREPSCAVSAAVETGALTARRYESYRRLRRLYEELGARRGPKPRR